MSIPLPCIRQSNKFLLIDKPNLAALLVELEQPLIDNAAGMMITSHRIARYSNVETISLIYTSPDLYSILPHRVSPNGCSPPQLGSSYRSAGISAHLHDTAKSLHHKYMLQVDRYTYSSPCGSLT